MMALGLIVLVAGFFIYQASTQSKGAASNNQVDAPPASAVIDSQTIQTESPTKTQTSEEKGLDFEKYVVKKFKTKYYKIKEWTSDKYVEGIYAEANLNPDMVVELDYKETKSSFAVECKWRKTLYNNKIEFATNAQLTRYREFSKTRGIPVFAVIGVSGTPGNPNFLYIMPLEKIEGTHISLEQLKGHSKLIDKDFFFDHETKTLR